ncbi:MAG: glutathione S-transferase family protein [Alphaproteobacteria bacterium]|nr:glutathione S-transferase family protein [Alphaproteobacteria bacterium]
MKLLTFPPSTNTRKVQLVAHTLGLPLEIAMVDLTKGEHRRPDFLALNPNGKIPVLVDGKTVLWESSAIMIHIAEKRPNALWPADPAARIDILRWLFWDGAHWQPTIAVFLFQNLVKPLLGLGAPDDALLAAARPEVARYAAVLDGHLVARDWIAGAGPTLADFAIAPVLHYAPQAKAPVEGYANVTRWMARIRDLPAWKATEPQFG